MYLLLKLFPVAAVMVLACYRTAAIARMDAVTRDIRVTASSQVAGTEADTLYVSLTAFHAGTAPLHLELRCNMTEARLVIATPARTRSWDSEISARRKAQAALRRGEYHIGCMGEQTRRLEPGERVYLYGLAVPVTEILGDSLPRGRYAVTARTRIGETVLENIPAGELQLGGDPPG